MVTKKSVVFDEVLNEVKKYIHKPENIDLTHGLSVLQKINMKDSFCKKW